MSFGMEISNQQGDVVISTENSTFICVQSTGFTNESWVVDGMGANDILVHTNYLIDDFFGNPGFLAYGGRLLVFRRKSLVDSPVGGFGLEVLSESGEVLFHSSEYPMKAWNGGGTPALVFQNVQFYWATTAGVSFKYGFPRTISSLGVVSTREEIIGSIASTLDRTITGISSTPAILDISNIPVEYIHPKVGAPPIVVHTK